MDMRMIRRSAIWAGILTLGAGAILAGCGGWIEPGAYKIYKLDVQKGTFSSSCFTNGPSPSTASDTDSWLSSSTWVVTTDTSGNIFLDLGDGTLQGSQTDSGNYVFRGTTVDVDFENDDPTLTKTTTTVDTRIDFTVDGKSIGGTATVATTTACQGQHCPGTNLDCKLTKKFSGTEVDNVELQYGVK